MDYPLLLDTAFINESHQPYTVHPKNVLINKTIRNLNFSTGRRSKAIIEGMKYMDKIIFRNNAPPSSC